MLAHDIVARMHGAQDCIVFTVLTAEPVGGQSLLGPSLILRQRVRRRVLAPRSIAVGISADPAELLAPDPGWLKKVRATYERVE